MLTLLSPGIVFSIRKSLLSNSSEAASRLWTVTLTLSLAGSVSSAGSKRCSLARSGIQPANTKMRSIGVFLNIFSMLYLIEYIDIRYSNASLILNLMRIITIFNI